MDAGTLPAPSQPFPVGKKPFPPTKKPFPRGKKTFRVWNINFAAS